MYQGQSLRCSRLDGDIAELCFDRQDEAINKFDRQTLTELAEVAKALGGDDSIKGLVVTSAKSGFIVGADIMEFGATFAQPEDQIVEWVKEANKIFTTIEDLPFPTVTAVNGISLGGGTEMALSTDYRVIADKAQIGLPEVKLGLYPGFGGT
ncbi:MAG: enoyl-CoA hydratase-related protein, partial [Pseudomonadota bacterium]